MQLIYELAGSGAKLAFVADDYGSNNRTRVLAAESSDQSYMVPSEATVDSARLAPCPSISELP